MSMSEEITKQLAAESKREAKGVSWDRYQAVCDELESLQYEFGILEISLNAEVKAMNETCANMPKIKADAIREAIRQSGTIINEEYKMEVVFIPDLLSYADRLERGIYDY